MALATMERWDGLAQQMAGQRGRKVYNCLCPDGRRRTVTLTGEADSFFSIPARVAVTPTMVSGKYGPVTVAGYVTGSESDDGEQDYEFRVVTYGKNCWVFPEHTLLPGASLTLRAGDGSLMWTGIISHWYIDRRPYWDGGDRWGVVVVDTYWNPDHYGPSGKVESTSTHSAEQLMRSIHAGSVAVTGGRQIGPTIIDFSAYGGGVYTN